MEKTQASFNVYYIDRFWAVSPVCESAVGVWALRVWIDPYWVQFGSAKSSSATPAPLDKYSTRRTRAQMHDTFTASYFGLLQSFDNRLGVLMAIAHFLARISELLG